MISQAHSSPSRRRESILRRQGSAIAWKISDSDFISSSSRSTVRERNRFTLHSALSRSPMSLVILSTASLDRQDMSFLSPQQHEQLFCARRLSFSFCRQSPQILILPLSLCVTRKKDLPLLLHISHSIVTSNLRYSIISSYFDI